jgi:hypothetical protein
MRGTYDPFSFHLTEIQAYDAGQRNWNKELRQHYLDELLADEAEEIAWGRRHLTILYGSDGDPVSGQILDELIRGMVTYVPPANWSRIGGVPGHHITVTLAGPSADQLIDLMADVAIRTNPGPWRVVATAVVVPGR